MTLGTLNPQKTALKTLSKQVISIHNTILKTYTKGRQIIILSERIFGVNGSGKKDGIKGLDFEIEDDEEKDPDENIRRSLSRTTQKLHDLVFSNEWDLFITVTFDKKKIDRYNYDEIVQRYSKQLDNIKQRKAKNLEYIFVPELHKDGAFHFHGLLRNIDGLAMKYSGRKDKKGQKVYNLSDFDLGFNTATYVDDTAKVSTYLIKYVTKDLITTLGESRKRYWCTKGLNRTQIDNFTFTSSEKQTFLDAISKNKITVSAKTVTVEKNSFTNTITYILLQDAPNANSDINITHS